MKITGRKSIFKISEIQWRSPVKEAFSNFRIFSDHRRKGHFQVFRDSEKITSKRSKFKFSEIQLRPPVKEHFQIFGYSVITGRRSIFKLLEIHWRSPVKEAFSSFRRFSDHQYKKHFQVSRESVMITSIRSIFKFSEIQWR